MCWPSHFLMRAIASLLAVGWLVAACANDPIRYIPEADRNMLQAQERLGTGGGKPGAISVTDMLRGVKAANAEQAAVVPPTNRVLLRFDGNSVQPDEAQRDTLRRFVAQGDVASLTVTSRPGGFDDPGSPVLGQRRAVAVSRELTAVTPDVQVRFDATLPPDVVVVSRNGAGVGTSSGTATP